MNLNGTNLSGVDLSETTDWRDAFYTEGENGTVFPDGFDPADNGTQLIQENSIYEEAFKKVAPYFW